VRLSSAQARSGSTLTIVSGSSTPVAVSMKRSTYSRRPTRSSVNAISRLSGLTSSEAIW
jgi:hypothetical protein